MRARDLVAVPAHPSHGRADRAVGRAPAEHERPRVAVGVVDLELRDVGGDVRHLLRPQPHHPVVVVGVVGDRAGHVRLLEPADPVLEARRCPAPPTGARASPGRAGTDGTRRRRSARSRTSVAIDGSAGDVGDQPGLGAVREGRIRQQVDRRAVLERDPGRLDRGVEALRRARGGDHRHGALAVAAEEHHQQVGLLGLRRHAGRRAGALDVEDEQRQLEHHAEADHLRLEHDPRPGRGRDAEQRRRTTRRAPRRRRRSRPPPGTSSPRSSCGAPAPRGSTTPA